MEVWAESGKGGLSQKKKKVGKAPGCQGVGRLKVPISGGPSPAPDCRNAPGRKFPGEHFGQFVFLAPLSLPPARPSTVPHVRQ